MSQKLLLACLTCCCAASTAFAQQVCTIEGTFSNTKLCHGDAHIQKVYLNRMNEMELPILVDSATVNGNSFVIRHQLKDGHQSEIYLLTGFDNGNTAFFVEPGTVKIHMDAAYPTGAHATGTPTNDLYEAYKRIGEQCTRIQMDSLRQFSQIHPVAWIDSKEGIASRTRIGGEAKFKTHLARMRFLLEHNDSPLSPLMMQKELLYTISFDEANRLRQSMNPALDGHPYEEAFSNAVLAKNISIGSELPNITMPTADNKKLTLKDFRGKYVLLDFWASWCGPCRREIPFVIKLYNETRSVKDKFVIVSFSLDNKKKAWTDAIPTMGMNLPDWVHVSDLYGWNSPAARDLGVSAIPKTFLLDPEGKLIAIDLRGDHMIQKVKELLGL